MKFVADNTSIPVLKIYCSFVQKNRAYIVMERIKGDVLPFAWKGLEQSEGKLLIKLRALESPGTGVQSFPGGSLRDSRMPGLLPGFGPFETIQEFHHGLRAGLSLSDYPDRPHEKDWLDVEEMIIQHEGLYPSPVFTQGDLHPFNISERGDKVALLNRFLEPFLTEFKMEKTLHKFWGEI
ncbi:hypothetical protein BJ875DRAFT_506304 [Amylocarpus encephaloides]|uniref:Aminoglycoside phosphotransferase domain-containing protein n=1 Tax=Amylocarpus encephaloides TaxID=45428 RepID=A0A9P7YE53_9HELO|nr:hypothetical protein BJ875DRAFT_506304 [Amylocarpus encephaloides]